MDVCRSIQPSDLWLEKKSDSRVVKTQDSKILKTQKLNLQIVDSNNT